MRGVVAIAAWMFASAALGLELNGAIFPDRVRVAPEGPGLSLNGAGERWIWVFKIYAIGLYLPQRKSTMSEVIAQQGPKRLLIIMQRDVTGWQVRQHLANRRFAHPCWPNQHHLRICPRWSGVR